MGMKMTIVNQYAHHSYLTERMNEISVYSDNRYVAQGYCRALVRRELPCFASLNGLRMDMAADLEIVTRLLSVEQVGEEC